MQIHKNFRKTKLFAIMLSVLLLCMAVLPVMSAAAFAGGDGSAKNPYLLRTAEDVNNIRKNLSAHYKLAATIDMSSIKNFEPIGTGKDIVNAKPFTGSLKCDLGADGLPRYAILNLSVTNNIGKAYGYEFKSSNYAGFGEKGVHYTAGLFAESEGATFENIYILNANIVNTVPGQHLGIWDNDKQMYNMFNEQTEIQATGILVARANSTTIDRCGTQGKINSLSNSTGGLVGELGKGTVVTRSWTDVNMNTQGFWHVGAFVGRMFDSQVQYCYAKGTMQSVSGASKGYFNGNSAAGFINHADATSVISNCYSSITLKNVGGANYVGGFCNETLTKAENTMIGQVSNCYTNSVFEGDRTEVAADNPNNNWVLNRKGALQKEFKGGTAEEIKAAFKSIKGWDVSGELPTLTDCAYVTDYSIWVAGQERAGAGEAQQGTSNNTTNNDQSGDTNTDTDTTPGTDASQNATDNSAQTQEIISPESNEVTPLYIVLFACIFTLIVAISTFSFVLLLPILKAKKEYDEYDEYDEYEDIDSGRFEEDL